MDELSVFTVHHFGFNGGTFCHKPTEYAEDNSEGQNVRVDRTVDKYCKDHCWPANFYL